MQRNPALIAAAGAVLFGSSACGQAESVSVGPAATPEKTSLESTDCPGGVIASVSASRPADAKGKDTPEDAADTFWADIAANKASLKDKGKGKAKRVDNGMADRTRVLFVDDAGAVLAQFDMVKDKQGWFVDKGSFC
jgi:hypothetical protein